MNNQKNKLHTPLLDEMAKPKEEQHPYIKQALWAYHEDVLNDELPSIILSPECEAGYIQGYLSGCKNGIKMADDIHKEIFAPTVNRYLGTGIADSNFNEVIN